MSRLNVVAFAELSKLALMVSAWRQTRRTRRQLQSPPPVGPAQERIRQTLLTTLAGTVRGRRLGVSAAQSEADFRRQIPLSTHDDLQPWVERMRRGEPDLLWPGVCAHYAATAGTTTGSSRFVPVTEAMQAHFHQATRATALQATARAGRIAPLRGRLLMVGGNTLQPPAAVPTPDQPHQPTTADLDTLAMLLRPAWAARHFIEPSARIALETDWETHVRRIVKRTRGRDVSALIGNPQWLVEFARHTLDNLSEGKLRYTKLQALWPELCCVFHGGTAADSHLGPLRELAGERLLLHEYYAAAEGFFAAQGLGKSRGLRLFYDHGIYYEFLPLSAYRPDRINTLGSQAVPLSEVEAGNDYVLIVTTPAGLLRHVTGDVVRFASVQPPRILAAGQVSLRLDLCNEALLAVDLIQALNELCRSRRWQLSHFHVAPLRFAHGSGSARGCHEWWIELRPGTVETPTGPNLATELDRRLRQSHPAYANARDHGRLDAPIVRLVMPGAFAHWLRHTGRWGGPHKLPACRNDRDVADSLARMARFSQD